MNFIPSVFRPHSHDHASDPEKGSIPGSGSLYPPPPSLPHRPTLVETQTMDQLNTFRHMIGIHSTKGFVGQGPSLRNGPGFLPSNSHPSLHFDGRAAPNVGIYNRVCHREAQAKRGYKYAALLINGCLGLQIIVAASLTALGAANSNHRAVTAFGAVNTVIAGLLTYLKGSGLPNRIRYYEHEWKRVREFIEQRERDFSRSDCALDVNQVVATIEAMYEQVKTDIQSNTPDNYVSVSDVRARYSSPPNMPNARGAATAGRSKIEELELKYGHKVTDFLESLAHKEEERLKRIEGDIDTSKARALAAMQEGRSAIHGGREHWEKELEDAKVQTRDWEKGMEEKGARMAERELAHARSGVTDWEREMEDKGARVAEREIEHARSGLMQRGSSFARGLEHARAGVLQHGSDISRDLENAKADAMQRGRDYNRDVQEKAARLAEAERELEREAERTREAAQRAGESIHHAGDSLQRAGDSMARVAKAVDDEIQPQRKG